MFRQHLIVQSAQGERDFRWRGGAVSRIEGLTDGVFALAVALLVISMEVPRTFDELVEAFVQAPVFLACFASLFWCWHAHFQFHRRYGLEDPLTLLLNGVLIFLVALFVYPLKFLFGLLWNAFCLGRGVALYDGHGRPVLDSDGRVQQVLDLTTPEMAQLTLLYGLGFAAVFGAYYLLTLHAWAWRDRLELDDRERLLTRSALWAHGLTAGFGVLSALLVALGVHPALAGGLYAGIGPAQFANGTYWERRVVRLRPEVDRTENPADDPVGGP